MVCSWLSSPSIGNLNESPFYLNDDRGRGGSLGGWYGKKNSDGLKGIKIMEVDKATLEVEGAREAMEGQKGIVRQTTTLNANIVETQDISKKIFTKDRMT